MRGSRWLRCSVSLVLLTGLFTGCENLEDAINQKPAKTDYTAPGSSGEKIEDEQKRGAEYHTDRVLPDKGQCGVTDTVLVTARQQVFACDNYSDYGELYSRAKIDAEGLAASFDCPSQCAPPVKWVSHHRWGCVDVWEPYFAFASVEISAMCPLEPYTPESLPPPDASSLGAPGQAGDTPTKEPGLFDEIGDFVEVQCNATELAKFEYNTPVAACAPMDFKPHVDQAQILAQKYHSSIPCATGCTRTPFSPRGVEWTCEALNGEPTVTVAVFFDVHCEV